ncbi:hypothetical protein BC833DRAFT_455157 [Globomyces pollinis-pini]|nr:hypothetical protein BC833DRAFT_455157 [Globomyces pollinis-pini]
MNSQQSLEPIVSPNTTRNSIDNKSSNSLRRPSSCSICGNSNNLIPVREIKPRYLTGLRQFYPILEVSKNASICLIHLKKILHDRVDELLVEDLAEFSKFQDDVMQNLKDYELGEDDWQAQFEKTRSFSDRAVDVVASFGGSWHFLFALLGFILSWAFINSFLNQFGVAWDVYPFTLLNVFLSMIAATQAPVIMMSQNRQADIDRSQTNYISKSILRNDNQTRHVDAKIDHLISYQWKRLLEIQEIQMQLLNQAIGGQTLEHVHRNFWSAESQPDGFSNLLLRHFFQISKEGDELLFTHWHEDGDNFFGYIRNVNITTCTNRLTKINFQLSFPNLCASLDDIFTGESNVSLRNDFNSKNLLATGKIESVHVVLDGVLKNIANGSFPQRFKPTFAIKRPERVNQLWKEHFGEISISYIPTTLAAVLHIPTGFKLNQMSATTYSETIPDILEYKEIKADFNFKDYLLEIIENERWVLLESTLRQETVGQFHTFDIKMDIVGPTVLMFKSDIRIGWQAALDPVRA